jgi:lactococcin 972 family bacteriocin
MSKKIKKGAIWLMTLAIAGTSGIALVQASENVGGGVWSHGVDVNVWSDYYHSGRNHSSTACNDSDCARSTAPSNATSKAWKITNIFTSHSAYWGLE